MRYISPEKFKGFEPYDPYRVDVYAVGVSLLETIVGPSTLCRTSVDPLDVAQKRLDRDISAHVVIISMLWPVSRRPTAQRALKMMQDDNL